MRKRIFALAAILVMIAVWLFISYRNLQSDVISRILPTQTSIFSGPVDRELIDQLQKPQWNGQISREQAIGLAELYCSQENASPEKNPSNIEANLMTEAEARSRMDRTNPVSSTRPVWLVSMEGSFEVDPPPGGPNETVVPFFFKHCLVIIDAKTGDMRGLQH